MSTTCTTTGVPTRYCTCIACSPDVRITATPAAVDISHERVSDLVDCLRYRPVATTAAQMREAADMIERLLSDRSGFAATVAQMTRQLADYERRDSEAMNSGDGSYQP